MKVIDIKNLERKESPIAYRKEYTGSAVFETLDKKLHESRIQFVLEKKPTGHAHITVDLLEDINFPLIQIVKRIKAHITEMDKEGRFP